MADEDEFGDLYVDVFQPVIAQPEFPFQDGDDDKSHVVRVQRNEDWGEEEDSTYGFSLNVKKEEKGAEFKEEIEENPVIPGLSAVSEGNEYREEDYESESDDDLRIVLNDEYMGRGFDGEMEGGEEEDDEEDLVIVNDGDQHGKMEEQEYGDEFLQSGHDGEKGEVLENSKGNLGNGSVGVRIGYSGHGFHGQHHSQFKYIRPGMGGATRGTTASAGPVSGQARPSLSTGSMSGRGRGMPKGYGAPIWGSNFSTKFYNGLDFALPSHKTIFEVDIDGFEEKPWRIPGVDISEFFNFDLDEDGWKDYRRRLEQLRLESTMKSKIRVYESGRSEQVYDPDLPPELAAASGIQDIYSDGALHKKTDGGAIDSFGAGYGALESHPHLPLGRAIQVEGGYGDRLPSTDTRRPRMRDPDAIIEIIPQECLDYSVTSNETFAHEGKDYVTGPELERDQSFADSDHIDGAEPASIGMRERVNKKEHFGPKITSNRESDEHKGPIHDDDLCHTSPVGSGAQVSTSEVISQQNYEGEREKSEARNGDEVLKLSPPQQEPSRDALLEGDADEKLALDDGDDLEYDERVSDVQDSGEVAKDDASYKSTSRIDQSIVQSRSKDLPRKVQPDQERQSSQRKDDRYSDGRIASSKGRQDSMKGFEKSKENEDRYSRRAKEESSRRENGDKKAKDGDVRPKKQDDSDRRSRPRDSASRQKDKDDIRKRKDEEQRKREDSKGHSQRKREDPARDSRVKQREKQSNEESQKHKEKDDRSGKGVQERVSGKGGGNSSKDRKRYPEKGTEYAQKRKREETHPNENKEKSSKHHKSSVENDHHRRSVESKKINGESRRESSREKKEPESGERKEISGKRRRGDSSNRHSEKDSLRGTRAEGRRHGHQDLHVILPPPPPLPPLPPPPPMVVQNVVEETALSDEDVSRHAKRGRSKLERWTSLKDVEFGSTQMSSEIEEGMVMVESVKSEGKEKEENEKDRHLETVAKLKKRSERFKVPLAGEKETTVAVGTSKKVDDDVVLAQSAAPTDAEIKQERPARKRRWASNG